MSAASSTSDDEPGPSSAAPLPLPGRIHIEALVARSWSIVRAHPVISTGIGLCVLLSLASGLFGIGVLVTPWFICELFAFQLAVLTGRPPERRASWIRAGLMVLGLVGVVVAATWLAALAVGPDVATADAAGAPLPWPEALERVLTIAGVTALAVGFITPFQYAPLILIERGGDVGDSVLESAWLVRRGGLARHWGLAFSAHLLPLAPALVAAVVVARTFDRAATPLGVLAGLPLLPLSIPLGQGLLSAAYVEGRVALAKPRWMRAESSPPSALIAALVAVVITPMLSIALLALGASRPTPLSTGRARGELVVARSVEGPSDTLHVPGTTLEVRVRGREVEVRSGDGGGAGPLHGSWTQPISRVRARRRGDVIAIELRAGDGWWHASVDRAAMRVDDSVGARLGRLPGWALPAIALSFLLSALLLVRGLEPLGAVRRAYGAPTHQRPPRAALRRERTRAIREAWMVAAALAPIAALALAAGVLASLG